jgi:mannosyltransferase OCH1-like enzyme
MSVCNIPKIIHQTWKDNNIPEKWKLSQTMWQKHHPDWQYILWTDKMIREYIKLGYPQFLKRFDSYKYNIQRVDMIRYFILKDFGGIYSDLDLYPVTNIENYFTSNNDVYLVFSGNVYGCTTNSFMASKKNALFWNDVLDKLGYKLPWFCFIKHMNIMYSTGPMFLSDVVKKHNNVVGILPGSKFMAYNSNEDISIIKKGAVLIPLEGKSWNSLDSHILNKVNQYKKHILVILIIIYIYLIVSYIKFMRRK